MFNSYIEARMHFNEKRKHLKEDDLKKLLLEIPHLLENALTRTEKEEIGELELDIEDAIDFFQAQKSEFERKSEELKKKEIEEVSVIKPSYDVHINILDDNCKSLWKETERELIRIILAKHEGNRTKTCEELGISIRTLRNKLNEYREEGNVETIKLSRLCESSKIFAESNRELPA